ncbi:MAG TPA: hypothetical protein VF533_06005 [Solirubrobacteraceae bacterium]|jgi:hypothetical protein
MDTTAELHEFTYDLLDTDWGSRFESFSARELRILRGFNDFGWQLGNRSFFRSTARLTVGAETELDHAGTEALELAATTLRQAWQRNDVGNHDRVLDILRERATGAEKDETLAVLNELASRFEETRSQPLMAFVNDDDLRAGRWPRREKDVTAAEVLDNWLHGTRVHLDPPKAAAVKRWSPAQYEWSVIKATTRLTRVVLATHVVVRGALGVLDEDRRTISGSGHHRHEHRAAIATPREMAGLAVSRGAARRPLCVGVGGDEARLPFPVPADDHTPEPGSKAFKARARHALIARLKELLPADRAALIDETGRTERFEDNLLSSMIAVQSSEIRTQLSGGDGQELVYGKHGERPDAHAAHSSAALACNAFGGWQGLENQLFLDGVDGFSQPLRFEAKQRIFRGGRAPNLDCLATGEDVVMGVESKLTEPLARHHRTVWSEAYGRESCRGLLSDGWLEALDAARSGSYAPTYLDADQLLKHALGIAKQHPERERHLLYVYWEPTNGSDFEEILTHRAEVEKLLDWVGEASPRLHALTYDALWTQWEGLNVPEVAVHLDCLRARYRLAVV